MDKSRGSSSEALSSSKRAREASPGVGVDLAYEAELQSKLESERAVRVLPGEQEDWEEGPERFVARSGTALPGSGGASGSGLDPWEATAASAGGGSSSSAPRPAPARGPVPPPRPSPRSFVAGAASRSGPRFGPGSSSSQAGDRRPPPSASGAPSAIRGDGILPPPPPPPPRQHPAPSGPSPTLTCFACHRPNHFQSRCTNPPFCLIYRSDGHLTVDCHNRTKSPSFIQFGLGLPGCSFFALDADVLW
nr:translation initiation factor IF-2-like [Aegilops tauschii subsp. strangulata]